MHVDSRFSVHYTIVMGCLYWITFPGVVEKYMFVREQHIFVEESFVIVTEL